MYDTLGIQMEADIQYQDDEFLNWLGEHMFKMHTQHGFPPDHYFTAIKDKKGVDLTLHQKVFVVGKYMKHFLNHRRLAGIEEKNIEKVRSRNREVMERFIKTGELGIY